MGEKGILGIVRVYGVEGRGSGVVRVYGVQKVKVYSHSPGNRQICEMLEVFVVDGICMCGNLLP